ncbi:hypothetical protein CRENBAI_018191 [Crenichthys baileyi]|uniref:Uncharacterized protein n=1 Tax=Crenichthys baileyi TaxID=28760 RepID=A0AAV9SPF2_9TELE
MREPRPAKRSKPIGGSPGPRDRQTSRDRRHLAAPKGEKKPDSVSTWDLVINVRERLERAHQIAKGLVWPELATGGRPAGYSILGLR